MNSFNFFLKLWALTLAIVMLSVCALVAQTVSSDNPFDPGTTATKVFDWYVVVYGAVVTLLTRLQAVFFPKAGSVPSVAVRYIIIAACVAGIFIAVGLTNGIGVVIGFLGSALTYDKVLVPLGVMKTPAPK